MKIIVIGCPGSGKSYLSKTLSLAYHLPLTHMDCIFWQRDWKHITRDELRLKIQEIMQSDDWIIDGNYASTLEDRFAKADRIYFLDLPIDVCLDSAIKRSGQKRSDLPTFLEEVIDQDFIDFIKNFGETDRKVILSCIEKYPEKELFTFHTREEVNRYIQNLRGDLA